MSMLLSTRNVVNAALYVAITLLIEIKKAEIGNTKCYPVGLCELWEMLMQVTKIYYESIFW